jgi:anionic cell wall polymer biosynthesis LytR-Cps2A-Psr (LCP) family protein
VGDATTTLTTVSFKKGPQHMDGKTSLTFVRSRRGTNGEGSDFARSRRQQKVLMAVKEKVLDLGMLLHPKKISTIICCLQ